MFLRSQTLNTVKKENRSIAQCRCVKRNYQLACKWPDCFYQFYCVHFRDANNSSADYVIELFVCNWQSQADVVNLDIH